MLVSRRLWRVGHLALAAIAAGSCSGQPDRSRDLASIEVQAAGGGPLLLSAIGQSLQLQSTLLDGAGRAATGVVVWSSGSPTVAAVDATGRVTGAGNGSAVITATSGTVAGSATVAVRQAPDTVSIAPPSALLERGASLTLSAAAVDANGHAIEDAAAWAVSDGAIASITSAGVATGLRSGSATVTATVDGKSAAALLTVVIPAAAGVAVTAPTNAPLASLGDQLQLSAAAADARGQPLPEAVLSWATSDASVATVGAAGLVTAGRNGTATISATSGTASGSYTAVVAQSLASLAVAPAAVTLPPAGTQDFAAQGLDARAHPIAGLPAAIWSVDDAAVSTIDSAGHALADPHAAAAASTRVRATIGAVSGAARLTVDPAQASVDSVVVSGGATLTALGATARLSGQALDAAGNPVPGAQLGWATSDATVAAVDAGGLVSAQGNGIATITASAGGRSDSAQVTVAQAVAAVTIAPRAPAALTSLGATLALGAAVSDANGFAVGAPLTWSSEDEGVATVSSAGAVTAVGNGIAHVQAAAGGKADLVPIAVQQAVASVQVAPSSATIAPLAVLDFAATAADARGHPLPGVAAWASDSALLAVDSSGHATAGATATLTVAHVTATVAGLSGSATVTVDPAAAIVHRLAITGGGVALASLGETVQLSAQAQDAAGLPLARPIAWSTSDASIASVDAFGLVSAVGNGTANLTASAGGMSAATQVTVAQVAASVRVTTRAAGAATTLTSFGDALQLEATGVDARNHDLASGAFTWRSDDATVAQVDASGLVTAQSRNGAAHLIARAANGVDSPPFAIAVGQVVAQVSAVARGGAATTLTSLGDTLQLDATGFDARSHAVAAAAFTWRVSGAAASVDASGLVSAVGNGSARVFARAQDGVESAPLVVAVAQAVVGVAASVRGNAPATLHSLGDSLQLDARARDARGNAVPGAAISWRAAGSAAVVDTSGLVTAVANGSASLFARSGAFESAGVAVAVAQAVASVAVTGTAALTSIHQSVTLAAAALDARGHAVAGQSFSWASSAPLVASVTASADTQSAAVVALGSGSASITATSSVGLSGHLEVAVAQQVASVLVSAQGARSTLTSLGQQLQLAATALDAGGTPVAGAAFTWSPAASAPATVDASGLVSARANGTQAIVATSGGVSGSLAVTVQQAVARVALSARGPAMLTSLGGTLQLDATALDAGGSAVQGAAFTWRSDNAAVLQIDQGGLATAHENGVAQLFASTDAIESAPLVATVAQSVAGVVVTAQAPATLASFGDTLQLRAQALDARGNAVAGAAFSWRSDSTSVSVDSAGLATAAANGTARVFASADGVESAGRAVSVAQVVAMVAVAGAPASFSSVNQSAALTATALDARGHAVAGQTFSWSSSAPAVVSVVAGADTRGATAVARANGSAAIVATSRAGPAGQLAASVAQLVATVLVSAGGAATTLTSLGQTLKLGATALDAGGTPVAGATFAWSPAQGAAATVDAGGLVTARANGTQVISAASGGRSGSLTATVAQLAATVTVATRTAGAATTLTSVGDTLQLDARAADAGGSAIAAASLSWRSDAAGVVLVDATGLATARSNGVANLVATSANGIDSAPFQVAVAQAVASVAVSAGQGSTSLSSLGDTLQLSVRVLDARGQPVASTPAWRSDSPSASVDAKGLVTAAANGAAKIFASAAGVESAGLSLSVAQVVAGVAVSGAPSALTSIGQASALAATAVDARGHAVTNQSVAFAWSSSAPGVATVVAGGDTSAATATARGNGVATITAASSAGPAGQRALTVAQAVASVVVSAQGTATLTALGQTLQLGAMARDAGGTPIAGVAFSWSPTASAPATVDQRGLVTARANGAQAVSASGGGVSGSLTVLVQQGVAAVAVAPRLPFASTTLTSAGDTLQLDATALDSGGSAVAGAAFSWRSAEPAIATVDAAGLVTAQSQNGTAQVVATSAGVDSAPFAVVVAQTVASVAVRTRVAGASMTLPALGANLQLDAEARDASGTAVAGATFSWRSDGPAVSIDSSGLVLALANGSANVFARAGAIESAPLQVVVAQAVVSVAVAGSPAALTSIGQSASLSATALDALGHAVPGQSFSWASSAPFVASVDASGTITARANGSAVITATSGAGPSGRLSVAVAQAVAAVRVTPGGAQTTLTSLGDQLQLSAQALDAGGAPVAGAAFSWSPAAAAPATVDATGLVTARANGVQAISATAGGVTGSATVTVQQLVNSVVVATHDAGAATTLVSLGETLPLDASALDRGGSLVAGATFSWRADDPAVVHLSTAGLATALGNGAAHVIATAGSVDSAPFQIIVEQAVASVAVSARGGASATLHSFGDTLQLDAQVRDALGNPVAAAAVWRSDAAGVPVDANGLVTAAQNGVAHLFARAGAVESSGFAVTVAQLVASVAVTGAPALLGSIGQATTFAAVALDARGHAVAGQTFAWSSSAPLVASAQPSADTLSASIVARANGSAFISATSSAGPAGQLTVSVAQVIAAVSLSASGQQITLRFLGETLQLTAAAVDAGGTPVAGAAFAWSSSGGAATVDQAGLATALGNGAVLITASAGGQAASLSVTVQQRTATVAVSTAGASQTLTSFGETVQLVATAVDAGGSAIAGEGFSWRSDDLSVVQVGSTGLATAELRDGVAHVVATSADGVDSAPLSLTVAQAVASVRVAKHNGADPATLSSLGDTLQLDAQALDARGNLVAGSTFGWRSGGAAVSVDANGLATAAANGSTGIFAQSSAVESSAFVVAVAQVVASAAVSGAPTSLTSINQATTLSAAALDARGRTIAGQTFSWSSSAPAVASVAPAAGSLSATVTAHGNGSATITATSAGVSGSLTVTVQQAVAGVRVAPHVNGASTTLHSLGDTLQLDATAVDALGNAVAGATFTWRGDSANASVSGSGLVTAVANGAANLFAKTGAIESAAFAVAVAQTVASISVTGAPTTLTSLNQTTSLTAAALDAGGHAVTNQAVTYSWSSSAPATATVSASANSATVTAKANGGATITATSSAGPAGALGVTVAQAVAAVSVSAGAAATTLTSINQTVQLAATASDALGSVVAGTAFSWTPLFGAPAIVNGTGLVTARTNGTQAITATAGTKSGSLAITVAQAVATVTVTPASATVGQGATASFGALAADAGGTVVSGAPAATWDTSNHAVATISAAGVATGVAQGGPVTVTATISGQVGTALLTVTQAVTTIEWGFFAQTAPPTTTVAAGTLIQWHDQDGFHSIVPDTVPPPAGAGPVNAGATFGQQSITAPGTYTYHCGIHPGMKGTIVVH